MNSSKSWEKPPDSVELLPEPQDEHFMRLALAEAAKGLGRTAPNPPVGCVIVQGEEVVGRGFHPQAGQPHAEVFALSDAGVRARGATAYVTLEPCSHTGRTPPCADALLAAGVGRVVVAATDPNPLVNGQGIAKLRAAGIPVTVGVLQAEAVRQQAGFRSLVQRGRPYVVYKYAMTLDGKIAAAGEANGSVTGAAARERVMQWRNEFDAVAVGRGTLQLDDPQLTTRGVQGGRNARAVLFDSRGQIGPEARAVREGTIIVTKPDTHSPLQADQRVTVLHAENLSDALQGLGQLGLTTLLLEGGPTLANSFFEAGLIDEVRAFIAPKLLGAGLPPLTSPTRPMHAAAQLQNVQLEQVGSDVLVTGALSLEVLPIAHSSWPIALPQE